MGRTLGVLALVALSACGTESHGQGAPELVRETREVVVMEFCCPETVYVPLLKLDPADTDVSIALTRVLVNGMSPSQFSGPRIEIVDEFGQPHPQAGSGGVHSLTKRWDTYGPGPHRLRVGTGSCSPFEPFDPAHEISIELVYTFTNPHTSDSQTHFPIVLQSRCGPAATLSWRPWIPKPDEDCTVVVNFAAPCDEDTDVQMNFYLGATPTLGESAFGIAAGAQAGSLAFSKPDPGIATFYAFGNPSPCHLFSGSREYLCHAAGDAAFEAHTGDVSSAAGAGGTMSVQVVYSIHDDPGARTNEVTWKVSYHQTTPVAFELDVDVEQGVVDNTGTFDGPDGEYDWSFAPHDQRTYSGALTGVLYLRRPDGTEDEIFYSLTRP
ncbi:MAG: hypothetical protein QNJ98_05255 [Planctomycetota bacterium]|nr:hypothetical protein [Planctomycetota bacterium]